MRSPSGEALLASVGVLYLAVQYWCTTILLVQTFSAILFVDMNSLGCIPFSMELFNGTRREGLFRPCLRNTVTSPTTVGV